MARRAAIAMAMSVATILWGAARASAVSLETLVMPGPVVTAHAEIEEDCRKCHEPFRQQAEGRLCLDCHADVRADVEDGQGHHGRIRGVAHAECRRCHTEHVGRRADIVMLNRDTFDHDVTDFPLSGAHVRVQCGQCHRNGKKFRDAPSGCNGCHGNDDPHGGSLGAECSRCHDAATWARTRFNHDTTGFRLMGAHAKASCASCHPDKKLGATPTACSDCHRMDDVHHGRRGLLCGDCHDVVRWDRATFDHDTRTDFPLRASHAEVPCESCHPGARLDDPLPRDCQGCHEADDPHRGHLGARCAACHGETDWRDTVRFDHDTIRFPLVGLHGLVPCEQCHLTTAYEDAPVTCVDCHAKNDVHASSLGSACATCHNPAGWPLWRFDHDRDTDFVLDGAHQGLACKGCHTVPMDESAAIKTTCVSCHRADDVHRGAYGSDCARCHSTATFQGKTGKP